MDPDSSRSIPRGCAQSDRALGLHSLFFLRANRLHLRQTCVASEASQDAFLRFDLLILQSVLLTGMPLASRAYVKLRLWVQRQEPMTVCAVATNPYFTSITSTSSNFPSDILAPPIESNSCFDKGNIR